jgi:hypothetical protein
LPAFYKDTIYLDEYKDLEEKTKKVKYLYDRKKGGADFQRSWRVKKKDKKY